MRERKRERAGTTVLLLLHISFCAARFVAFNFHEFPIPGLIGVVCWTNLPSVEKLEIAQTRRAQPSESFGQCKDHNVSSNTKTWPQKTYLRKPTSNRFILWCHLLVFNEQVKSVYKIMVLFKALRAEMVTWGAFQETKKWQCPECRNAPTGSIKWWTKQLTQKGHQHEASWVNQCNLLQGAMISTKLYRFHSI